MKIEKSPTRSKEFWERLSNEFQIVYIQSRNQFLPQTSSNENGTSSSGFSTQYSFKIFSKVCASYAELKQSVVSELDNLVKSRKSLIQKTKVFFDVQQRNLKIPGITAAMVRETADCHLRKKIMPNAAQTNEETPIPKCELCKCENAFREYSRHLYANSDDAIRIASSKEKNNDEEEDEEKSFDDFNEQQAQYQLQIKSTSDLEKLNRMVLSFAKSFHEGIF